jgi:hypothetical protein
MSEAMTQETEDRMTWDHAVDELEEAITQETFVTIDEMTDNEDGSMTMKVTMDFETMKLFAAIGLEKTILETAQRIVDGQDS